MTFSGSLFPVPDESDSPEVTGPRAGPWSAQGAPGETAPAVPVDPLPEAGGEAGAGAAPGLRGRDGTLEMLRAAAPAPENMAGETVTPDAAPVAVAATAAAQTFVAATAAQTFVAATAAQTFAAATVAPQTHLVHTIAELQAAFDAAGDGDRIELAAGVVLDEYVVLRGKSLDGGLTITSQDPDNPGVFSYGLELFNVDNLVLSDIDFHMSGVETGTALFLRGSDGVVLRDLEMTGYIPGTHDGVDPLDPATRKNDPITGYGIGRAIRVKNGEDIEIENVGIDDFKGTLLLEDLSDVTVTGLDVTGVREGLNMFDVTGVTIADSSFRDFRPWWNGDPAINDHADMFQYWGTNSDSGVHDITIRGNIFDQGEGWTQTIFGGMGDAPDGVTATGFHILDNVIINRHPNTIRLDGVEDAVIENNLLLGNTPEIADGLPRIDLRQTGTATLRDNVVIADSVTDMSDAEVAALGNMLLSPDAGEEDYWGLLLDAWRAGDEFVMDGSSFIDQAREILGLEDDGGVEPPDGDPAPGMEIGTLSVEAGAETWRSVSFSEEILDARVVMGPVGSAAGADPMVVRVRNVTDSGFEYLIDEWDYLDGVHVAAEVSWMAASAGTHRLASGVQISAGRTTVVDDARSVVDLPAGHEAPVVLAQVTSANEADSVTTRVVVNGDRFRVEMDEQEASDGQHAAESIDWIGLDGAGGELGAALRMSLNPAGTSVALPGEDGFALLAAMQSQNGRETAALAYEAAGGAATLWVQEETSQDAELRHTLEDVALFLPETGFHDLFAL